MGDRYTKKKKSLDDGKTTQSSELGNSKEIMDQMTDKVKDMMGKSPKEIALDRAIQNDQPSGKQATTRIKFDTSKKINCIDLNDKFEDQIRIFKDHGKLKSKYMKIKLEMFENSTSHSLFEP